MLPEVYGIPLFWPLDHREFAVYLVNARYIKNIMDVRFPSLSFEQEGVDK